MAIRKEGRKCLPASSQKTITAWFLNTPRLYDSFYSQKDNLRSCGQWGYCSLETVSGKEKRISWHLGSRDKILWYSSGKKKVDFIYNCKLEKVKMLLYFIFIYLWLLWVFTAATWAFFGCDKHGLLSGCSAWISPCDGMGSRAGVSVVMAHGLWREGSVFVVDGLSCPEVCGIFPDQGLNLCLLHWQADF